MIIPVVLTVYSDRSFSIHPEDAADERAPQEGRGPPTGKKPGAGSKEPNKNKVGKVTDEAGARARRSRRWAT
jgi:large subunit ribosomal protein L11